MGTYTSQPFTVADGAEWVTYLEGLTHEIERMLKEGRVPESEGVHSFLDFCPVVMRRVRAELASATASARQTTTVEFAMTAEDYRGLLGMAQTLRTLMEILELREAVVLNRTDGIERTGRALFAGTYTD